MFQEFLNQSTVFCSQSENGKWYSYVLLVLFTFALPVGILGNVAALIYYICLRKTWSTSNVFLLNLALCDSAWILTLPFTVYFAFQRPHIKDMDIFCQFKKISFNINVYGSIHFLALVSFYRSSQWTNHTLALNRAFCIVNELPSHRRCSSTLGG